MVLEYSADERERLLEEPFDRPAVAVCYLLRTLDGRVVFDLVAREARYPHRALLAPLLQPIVGHLPRQFLVREDRPQRGPRPGHHPPDVVGPATYRDPPPSAQLVGKLMDPFRDVLVGAGRHRQGG